MPDKEKTPSAAERADSETAAAIAEAREQGFYAEVAQRTGLSLSAARKTLTRLREEGDFMAEEGRWTLDGAGWPVLIAGWKEPPKD